MPNNVRNEIKSYIAKSGMTLKDIIAEYNKTNYERSAKSGCANNNKKNPTVSCW